MEERLADVTGKKNVLEKIAEENNEIMKSRLEALGLAERQALSARDIYEALIHKIEKPTGFYPRPWG